MRIIRTLVVVEFCMDEKKNERSIYWRGVIGGMIVGALIPVVSYLYAELTHPNPYNVYFIFYSPVLMIFRGIGGLLWAAWYISD